MLSKNDKKLKFLPYRLRHLNNLEYFFVFRTVKHLLFELCFLEVWYRVNINDFTQLFRIYKRCKHKSPLMELKLP